MTRLVILLVTIFRTNYSKMLNFSIAFLFAAGVTDYHGDYAAAVRQVSFIFVFIFFFCISLKQFCSLGNVVALAIVGKDERFVVTYAIVVSRSSDAS